MSEDERRSREHYIALRDAREGLSRAVRTTGLYSPRTQKAKQNLRETQIRELGIYLGPGLE